MTLDDRLRDALQAEDRHRRLTPAGDVDRLIRRGRRRLFVTRTASIAAGVVVLAGAGVGVSQLRSPSTPAPVIGQSSLPTPTPGRSTPSPTAAPTTPGSRDVTTATEDPTPTIEALAPVIGLDRVLHRVAPDGARTDLWENIAFRIADFAADPRGDGAFVGIHGQNDPPSSTIGRVGPTGDFEPLVEGDDGTFVNLLDVGIGPDGATLLVYAWSGPVDGAEQDQLRVRDLGSGEDRSLWSVEGIEGIITHADLETDRIAYVHDNEGFTTAHVVTLDGEQLLDPIGRFGDAGPDGAAYAGIALEGDRLVIVEDHRTVPTPTVELVVRTFDGTEELRTPVPVRDDGPADIGGVTARGGHALVTVGPLGDQRTRHVDIGDGPRRGSAADIDTPGAFRLVD